FLLHKEFINNKFSDESSLFFFKNFKVKIIKGDHNNIKITLKKDYNFFIITIFYFIKSKKY
ncbi:MAG: 2-C-methyl-D-erythritol 4-phosphate cytidylyltransferase, partial [Pseudomonadota bacterium]